VNASAQQTEVMQRQNSIADEQLKSQVLQNYTSTIQDLILHEKLLESKIGDNVRTIATTQTALALRQLDSERKGNLLRFIYQLKLIDTKNLLINLNGADLSRADLNVTNLRGADLNGAYLNEAYLSGADLSGADLSKAYLSRSHLYRTNFSGTHLFEADLSEAYLSRADLSETILNEADLSGADLSGADLSGAKIADWQLKEAKSLQGTIMPDGSKHP
jgi:uncharacterized protein YjbI with pentapeptide repeats